MEQYNEYRHYESELAKVQRFRRMRLQRLAWVKMKVRMLERGLKVTITEEDSYLLSINRE